MILHYVEIRGPHRACSVERVIMHYSASELGGELS